MARTRLHRSAHNDIRHSTQLVDISYHIHQVAARVTKLDLGGAFGTRILDLGEGEVLGVSDSAMVPFERAMAVSNKLFIVIIALSVCQYAIKCLRRSNHHSVCSESSGYIRLPPNRGSRSKTVRDRHLHEIRTPIQRLTTRADVTGSRNTSVVTEINSRYTTSIDTVDLFQTVWPETNYFRFTLPVCDKLK